MYAALVAFKEQHKHCRVPTGCPDNPKLGHWVTTQRHVHKNGKLSEKRAALLQDIGFVWDPYVAKWQRMYAALVAFKEETGHSLVPQCHPDNPKLGQWVNTQRTLHRKGKLSDERMALLEAIGFVWDARAAR